MLKIISRFSSGTLRTWKIPACATSIKNAVFSAIFEVTVIVSTTSYMPSSILLAELLISMPICGASRSVKICGALGHSNDKSFTYNFSMPKPGA